MKTLASPSYEENKMKLRYAMVGIVLLGSSASGASTSAQPPKDVMEIVRAGDINWMASRFGADLPIAILAGDPSTPGPYVMRVTRSEERRAGKEGVRTCRSRWGPEN